MPIGATVENKNVSNKSLGNRTSDLFEFELTEPRHSLADLVLNKKTMDELKAAIALKTQSEYVYNTLGFSETHSYNNKFIVNFYGVPGTGKTMAAHAMAHAFSKKLLVVDYSQIESKYVGDTPKNLVKIFDFAKGQNCLIFFDEADAILSRRVTNMTSATDTSVNQTRSVMLNILNDFSGSIVFATNFVSNYDSAFMRRILKHVQFHLPDFDARLKMVAKYLPAKVANTLDLIEIAKESEGLSGAEISNVTLMTAFQVASEGRGIVAQEDIFSQIKNVKLSKQANSKHEFEQGGDIQTSIVSKEYVEKQIGKEIL